MLEHLYDYVTGQVWLQRSGAVESFGVYFAGDHETLTVTVTGISVRVADAFDAGLRLLTAAFGGEPDEDDQMLGAAEPGTE